MHAASATPQPGDDRPKVRANKSNEAVDDEGAETEGVPAAACSHCTRLLRHRGGRNAIDSAQTRMSMDLSRVKLLETNTSENP